jgi:hypothetical protein
MVEFSLKSNFPRMFVSLAMFPKDVTKQPVNYNDKMKIISHNYVCAILLLHVSSLVLMHHNGMSLIKPINCYYSLLEI